MIMKLGPGSFYLSECKKSQRYLAQYL